MVARVKPAARRAHHGLSRCVVWPGGAPPVPPAAAVVARRHPVQRREDHLDGLLARAVALRVDRPMLQRLRRHPDSEINAWLEEQEQGDDELRSAYITRITELFKAEFPQRDREDLRYMRRVLQQHGVPQAPQAPLTFAAGFDAHLTGGHFHNGGAGYHIYDANTMPAGVTGVVFGVAYDGGARQGTVQRAHGGNVASTFFPAGWTTARVRREVLAGAPHRRQLHGLVHLIPRGRNKFAICVNITNGEVVSAFPAHRDARGHWTD
jgi:hypothetical protein